MRPAAVAGFVGARTMRRLLAGLVLDAVGAGRLRGADRRVGRPPRRPPGPGRPGQAATATSTAASSTWPSTTCAPSRAAAHLAPEWHPVPYTRAVAAAVGELLAGDPYLPGLAPAPPGRDPSRVQVDDGTPPSTCPGLGHGCRAGRPGPGPHPDPVLDGAAGPGQGRRPVRERAAGPRQTSCCPRSPWPSRPRAVVAGKRLVVKGEASVYEGTSACACATTMARSWPRATPPPPRAPRPGAVRGRAPLHPARRPPPLDPEPSRSARGRRDRLLGLAAGVGGSLAASNAGLDIARPVRHDARLIEQA